MSFYYFSFTVRLIFRIWDASLKACAQYKAERLSLKSSNIADGFNNYATPFASLDSNAWSHRFKRLNRWDQTFESTRTKGTKHLLKYVSLKT